MKSFAESRNYSSWFLVNLNYQLANLISSPYQRYRDTQLQGNTSFSSRDNRFLKSTTTAVLASYLIFRLPKVKNVLICSRSCSKNGGNLPAKAINKIQQQLLLSKQSAAGVLKCTLYMNRKDSIFNIVNLLYWKRFIPSTVRLPFKDHAIKS